MSIYIGVDPGQTGGLVILYEPRRADGISVIVRDFKHCPPKQVVKELKYFLAGKQNIRCCFESVHSMPQQGVASSFKFGSNTGIMQGILHGLEIEFELVTPQKWQKEFGLIVPRQKGVKLTQKEKNELRKIKKQRQVDLANKLCIEKFKRDKVAPFPMLNLNTADAFLIAEYARRMDVITIR